MTSCFPGNLLHSLAHLNAYEENLVKHVTTKLHSNLQALQKTDYKSLVSILFSLARLKYKHTDLVDDIVDILLSNPQSLDFSEEQHVEQLPSDMLISLILSCASLNYMPKKWRLGQMLGVCMKKIWNSPDVDKKVWLETVYALVILQVADASFVASVLRTPGNIDCIKSDNSGRFTRFTCLKNCVCP